MAKAQVKSPNIPPMQNPLSSFPYRLGFAILGIVGVGESMLLGFQLELLATGRSEMET